MDKLVRQLEQRCVSSSIEVPVFLFSEDDTSNNSAMLYDVLVEIKRYNANYVKLFIQRCILDTAVEKYLIDWIYDLYLPLLKENDSILLPQEQVEDKIIYRLSAVETDKIIILEKPKLIAETSTTGFRTWEAAIYLCKYLQINKETFEKLNGNWIELGAGTGMTSIYLSKLLSPNQQNHIYITDGDEKIVDHTIAANVKENDISKDMITLSKLRWGKTEHEGKIPTNINYIIGTDILYDDRLFLELCETLYEILMQETCQFALICSTIRNVDTDIKFQQVCEKFKLKIECVNNSNIDPTIKNDIESDIIYRKLVAPTKIYKITI